MTKEEMLSEEYGCETLEGFEDAILGITTECDTLVYGYDKMIDVVMKRDGISYGEAMTCIFENYIRGEEKRNFIIMEWIPKNDNPLGTLFDMCEGSIVMDGLDKAIIGCTASPDKHLIYDYEKICEVLMERDGMDYEEAMEFTDYNTVRALPYMGPLRPYVIYPVENE